MKVIAIVNEKGGVGKTTTATALSYLLTKKGKKVCLIDFDGQAHSTVMSGFMLPDKLDNTISDVMNELIQGRPIEDAQKYIQKTNYGADLVPANSELFTIEGKLYTTLFSEKILKDFVDGIKAQYDYVIIDVLPQTGINMINAMMASDYIIIPTQAELLSAKGILNIQKHIKAVQMNGNPNLEILGILITMDNKRTINSKQIKELITQTISEHINVFSTVIPRRIKAAEACLHGKTVCEYAPKDDVSIAYEKFSGEVLELVE